MYIFVKKKKGGGGGGGHTHSPTQPHSSEVPDIICRLDFRTLLLTLTVVVGLTLSQSATFIENVTRMVDSSPRNSATFFYLQFLQCIFPIL